MKKILSADTSTSINTVSVCDGEMPLAETSVLAGRKHSERLLETVDWVLGEAEIKFDDIDLLAISNGPGSFTGLRVGLATWKGLAFAKKLPLVAVPTLDAMSRICDIYKGNVCPLLDAKMDEVFGAVYSFENGQRSKLTEDLVCSADQIANIAGNNTLFFGDGATRYKKEIKSCLDTISFTPDFMNVPRAATVAVEALKLVEKGVSTDPAAAIPIYLRKSQAELNREK